MPGMAAAGVGSSRDVDGVRAATEAVTQALSELDADVETLVLFAAGHADPGPCLGAADDVAKAAGATAPRIVGCSASGVLTQAHEIEGGPGVSVLALAKGSHARPFLWPRAGQARPDLMSELEDLRQGLVVLLADAYSAPPERVLAQVSRVVPSEVQVCGTLAVSPSRRSPSYRWLDGVTTTHGVAGLVVPSARPDDALVSVASGCRLIGAIRTVTKAEGNVVSRLDQQSAFDAFAVHARPLLDDLPRAAQTLFLALPLSSARREDPFADGHRLCGVLKFDPERGLLALTGDVPVGTPVRFALRDAASARENLSGMMEDVKRRLGDRRPKWGLYLCSAGRGHDLYGVRDHDVSYLQGALGEFPLAGMFGGGELCRDGLQLFSGVLALVMA
jgi:small ligand-binding sensory domain FIST